MLQGGQEELPALEAGGQGVKTPLSTVYAIG